MRLTAVTKLLNTEQLHWAENTKSIVSKSEQSFPNLPSKSVRSALPNPLPRPGELNMLMLRQICGSRMFLSHYVICLILYLPFTLLKLLITWLHYLQTITQSTQAAHPVQWATRLTWWGLYYPRCFLCMISQWKSCTHCLKCHCCI